MERFIVALVALAAANTLCVADLHARISDEDGTKAALVKIAGEGLLESHAFEYLTQLSDDIGARVTGSPSAQNSVEWSLKKMRDIGLENVHAEPWQMWRGWTRGTADAQLIAPIQRRLTVDAMGWTGSTPAKGAEGEMVSANIYNLDEELKNPAKFSGKIVLMITKGEPKKDSMAIFVQFGDFVKQVSSAGAIGVFGGQGGFKSEGMNLTHTGILGFQADFAIPVLSLTAEDQAQLERFLAAGKKITARLNVQNTFSAGPVESANAVGEIRGREHPDEILVVGAHLDSWDLSEGATDNGMGSVSVLGAAEAIIRSGQKPRRTIRFVLFTGEEQGLLGSFAYVKQHQSEMSKHIGDLVLDEGQGPVKEFQLGGRDDLVAGFQGLAELLGNIQLVKVTDKVEFGTDTGPFILAGLPGINMNQDSPEYKFTHHSAGDALEAVKPDVLAQNATLMGMTAYWIADRAERLAKPWPAKRTALMLRQQHQYEMLKAFDLWPFGNLGSEEKEKSHSGETCE